VGQSQVTASGVGRSQVSAPEARRGNNNDDAVELERLRLALGKEPLSSVSEIASTAVGTNTSAGPGKKTQQLKVITVERNPTGQLVERVTYIFGEKDIELYRKLYPEESKNSNWPEVSGEHASMVGVSEADVSVAKKARSTVSLGSNACDHKSSYAEAKVKCTDGDRSVISATSSDPGATSQAGKKRGAGSQAKGADDDRSMVSITSSDPGTASRAGKKRGGSSKVSAAGSKASVPGTNPAPEEGKRRRLCLI